MMTWMGGINIIRPGSRGRKLIVKFVESYVDYGAPEFVVTTMGEIKRISAGQVEITYVRRREETVAVCRIIYDFEEWRKICRAFDEVRASILFEMQAAWMGAQMEAQMN